VPRESRSAKKQRAEAILDRLHAQWPNAKIELDYREPIQLLVSVILSAQCTDVRVNLVTPALFRRYPDAAAYAAADPAELESLIKTCGLYRTKARNIIAAAKSLVERFGGKIPLSRSELESLPGVGKKTAGVVCIHLGGDSAFPVDTHIRRLARRMGLSAHQDPDKVELDLQALFPRTRWSQGHQLLIWHGRRTCFARNPACERCVVAKLCPKIGVRRTRPRPAALVARP
jgi:endonuclease-3